MQTPMDALEEMALVSPRKRPQPTCEVRHCEVDGKLLWRGVRLASRPETEVSEEFLIHRVQALAKIGSLSIPVAAKTEEDLW